MNESAPQSFGRFLRSLPVVQTHLLFLFAVSVSFIVVGLPERLPIYYTRFKWSWTRYSKTGHSQGWLIDGFPAQYLGYLLLLFTAAGFGGIYIW
tara:strand:+ start:103 stop:384 length:282 start_codon:yes stop_codon:yes gene_type:complete